MQNLPTLQPKSSASNESTIDVLFARLFRTYGRQWIDLWAGQPMAGIKHEWAAQLSEFAEETIARAFGSLRETNPKFPPNLNEFGALCKQFKPRPEHALRLPDHRRDPMPEHIRAQFAKLKIGMPDR